MPKVSYHQEATLRRAIRDAMAFDPIISINALQKVLEKKLGRSLARPYISKLVKSISGEMAVVADREKVEERITYLRESNRIVREELLRIAFPAKDAPVTASFKDRVAALQAVARIDNMQIKIEMDLGLYTRHIGQLDIDQRSKPIDAQTLETIVTAFGAWAAPVAMRKVEITQSKIVKAEVIKNDNPKAPTNTPTAPVAAKAPTGIPITANPGLVATE